MAPHLAHQFWGSIEGVLFRVRIEPAKQVRGRHFLEFDGCDHAQDFVPLLNHNLVIRIASGLDLPGGTVYPLAVPENIEPLALQVLEAGRVGKSQQMAHGEDQLAEAKGVGRMPSKAGDQSRQAAGNTLVLRSRKIKYGELRLFLS